MSGSLLAWGSMRDHTSHDTGIGRHAPFGMVGFDRSALADSLPLVIPAIPFGFVLGLAMTESEMPLWVAALSSPLIFGGASQLALVTLAGSASLWALCVAVLVINSRHIMYSAALASAFREQPRWFRWLAPWFLVDQIFALASVRPSHDPDSFRGYYLSCAVVFVGVWNVAAPVGMLVGPIVPESWRLEFAPVFMFAGLTLFAINRRPAALAAIVGGGVSLIAVDLSDRLGIVVGALCGVTAAVAAEELIDRPANR